MLQLRRSFVLTLLFAGPVLAQDQAAPSPDEAARYASRSLEQHDVDRIAELYRLTDRFGDALWPGYDLRDIPIAVNHDDRQEMLFAHPSPPAEFRPSEILKLGDRPVLVREGCTRYGPRGGGWAIELGGEQTAYVCTLQPGQSTEELLSALIHEGFHVYQRRFQSMPRGGLQEPPDSDPEYAARIALESRVLQALIAAEDDEAARDLARQFVAVRRARYASLTEEQIRYEGINEYNEGTASYLQARLYQLLAENGALEPEHDVDRYTGFENAAELYRDLTSKITPPEDALVDLVHGQYLNGMGMCLALDRLRPGWKKEMSEPGRRQYDLIDRELEVPAEDESELLARAEKRFGWSKLLARQKELLEQHLAKIRSFLEAPGRHYRIHHGVIRSRFDWDTAGPVYDVPDQLIPDPAIGPVTIWGGGIRRFEKGDLDFTGQPVPVIFRFDYLEWIDPDPAADESDLRIAFDRQDGDVFIGARIETDGFILTLPRARIVRTPEQVDVYPVVGDR